MFCICSTNESERDDERIKGSSKGGLVRIEKRRIREVIEVRGMNPFGKSKWYEKKKEQKLGHGSAPKKVQPETE